MSNTNRIATKLETFGFHHTLVSNFDLSEEAAADLFDAVARLFIVDGEWSAAESRRALDSRYGRHLADCGTDEVVNSDLEQAARFFHRHFRKWMQGRRFAREMSATVRMSDSEFYSF